jgi:phosphohistidine swiveling domain-containing protein
VNSFLPASVPDKTAEKIINFGLERLKEDLTRHDKIEFDIVPTCLDFNFAIWTQRYMDAGALTAAETSDLEDGLRSVTRSTIARAQTDVEAAEDLERRCKGILDDAKLGDGDWVRFILDMCRDKGALNFAHLARAGFVAVAFLKSAVDQKFINEKRYNQLLNSVKTVGGLMQAEAWNVKTGKLDFAKFVERFGHIRPGTYDISAPSYKDRSDLYLAPMIEGAAEQAEGTFSWTEQEADAINEAFTGLDVGLNANTFLAFFHTAISGREYSKFVFTRLLSAVLDRIGGISRECGLSSEQSESLSLDGIIQGACNIWGRNAQIEILQDSSRRRIEQRKLASLVLLPPVFTQPQVVRGFVMPRSSANFVTRNKVIAPLVVVRTDSEPAAEKLEGKIAAIVNADPGYDYLFSVKIAGLITAFGGPNSHMAIRAAEFGLPAAIGVGEDAFMNFVDGLDTELDCHKKRCFQHLIV